MSITNIAQQKNSWTYCINNYSKRSSNLFELSRYIIDINIRIFSIIWDYLWFDICREIKGRIALKKHQQQQKLEEESKRQEGKIFWKNFLVDLCLRHWLKCYKTFLSAELQKQMLEKVQSESASASQVISCLLPLCFFWCIQSALYNFFYLSL